LESKDELRRPSWETDKSKFSSKLIRKVGRAFFYLLSFPFHIRCGKVGKNFLIGPGYSLWKCNLKNVIIGDNVSIGYRASIITVPLNPNYKPSISIGNNTNIGDDVIMAAAKKISIGKNCLISYDVSIIDHNHAFENVDIPPLLQGIDEPKEIEIGDDCFLGAHSFILKGVTLGRHCVVGANSVVTSSFADYSVIAGAPARKIRSLK
jgi:acetyltransferase-like isoleucine patch superfamily enzyme